MEAMSPITPRWHSMVTTAVCDGASSWSKSTGID